ncbi:hypothetical protein GCM10028798_04320 [Humibacter antri]
MRISDLARMSGVPVATIKYYLREGILSPGEARGATQAEYGEGHVRRLRLIRSLADVAGLPIARIKVILSLIDQPHDDLFTTLGEAIQALPPYPDRSSGGEHELAKAAIERLGWTYDGDFAATAQLELALHAVADAGIPITDERLDAYGASLHRLAEVDIALMPGASTAGPGGTAGAGATTGAGAGAGAGAGDATGAGDTTGAGAGASSSGQGEEAPAFLPSAAVEYAVLGTALYEPVVTALRRLAHQDVVARMLSTAPRKPAIGGSRPR